MRKISAKRLGVLTRLTTSQIATSATQTIPRTPLTVGREPVSEPSRELASCVAIGDAPSQWSGEGGIALPRAS